MQSQQKKQDGAKKHQPFQLQSCIYTKFCPVHLLNYGLRDSVVISSYLTMSCRDDRPLDLAVRCLADEGVPDHGVFSVCPSGVSDGWSYSVLVTAQVLGNRSAAKLGS